MAAEPRGERAGGAAHQIGELLGEIGEVFGVEWGEVGEEHGPVAEVFGDGGVAADARDGGEVHGGLLLEELEGRVELVAEEEQLRLVPFRVALHLRLE